MRAADTAGGEGQVAGFRKSVSDPGKPSRAELRASRRSNRSTSRVYAAQYRGMGRLIIDKE
jgi:hypothetical protein